MEGVSKRMTLRPLTLADVPALLPWYNDRSLHAIVYTRNFSPYTLDELAAQWKKKLNRPHARYDAIEWDGQVVGRVGLVRKPPHLDIAEYSILIGPSDLQGRGLGTAVTRRMIAEAFADPQVRLVRLYVRQDNRRAIRCYEKAGLAPEFAFKQNGVPTLMMQIDRRQWQPDDEKGLNAGERKNRLERQA